jgi:hypothetical protein
MRKQQTRIDGPIKAHALRRLSLDDPNAYDPRVPVPEAQKIMTSAACMQGCKPGMAATSTALVAGDKAAALLHLNSQALTHREV